MDSEKASSVLQAEPSREDANDGDILRQSLAVVFAADDEERNPIGDGVTKFPSCDPLGLETIIDDPNSLKLLKNQDKSQSLHYECKNGIHTFTVPLAQNEALNDPTYSVTSVEFELAPISVTESQDGRVTQEFTIVPAGTVPMSLVDSAAASSETATSRKRSNPEPNKKRKLKRTKDDVATTALSKNRIKFDDEVLNLECEWEKCTFRTEVVKNFMTHVGEHVADGVPTAIRNESDIVDEDEIDPEEPETVYACLWRECGHETPSRGEIARHINFHTFHTKLKAHGKNVLAATEIEPCKLDKKQRNFLPDLTEPFTCFWESCDVPEKSFVEPMLYYWHVQWHTEELRGETPIQCFWKDCGSTYKSVAKLRDHVKVHTQERIVACPICGSLFANRSKFFDHCQRQISNPADAFKCSYCNKRFAIERLLRDHMRAHINQFKCPLCDMTCPQPSNLVNHMSYRHFQVRSYQCPKQGCPYKAKTNNDLQKHYRIHLDEGTSYACPYNDCKYFARSRESAKAHIDKVHLKSEPKYACHLCERRFAKGYYLTKHLLTRHKLRYPSGHTRFRYRCDEATGLHTLNTIRFESVELLEKEANPDQEEEDVEMDDSF